jgi:hypothetical protein
MLTRFHKILIGLFIAQAVLAVIVLSRGDDRAAHKEHPLFAGFDAAKVTRVQVFGDKPADKIDVVKRGASWVLASGFDYPADGGKVGDALAPIAKLTAGEPIATQASRHKQLHVADDDFTRKLVMTVDGKDLTVFIGGSAGVRRTAVRLAGSDAVYAVAGITATSLGVEPKQWVDPTYVKVPAADLAKIVIQRDGQSVELTKLAAAAAGSGSDAAPPPDHWTATIGGAPITLGKDESIDEPAITRIVDEVTAIDLTAPADVKRDASHPTATITLERKPGTAGAGAPVVVDLIVDGTSVWVHDRSAQRAVLADKFRLDAALTVDHDKLVKKPPPPAPKGAPGAAANGLPPGVELPPGMELPPGVQIPPAGPPPGGW